MRLVKKPETIQVRHFPLEFEGSHDQRNSNGWNSYMASYMVASGNILWSTGHSIRSIKKRWIQCMKTRDYENQLNCHLFLELLYYHGGDPSANMCCSPLIWSTFDFTLGLRTHRLQYWNSIPHNMTFR